MDMGMAMAILSMKWIWISEILLLLPVKEAVVAHAHAVRRSMSSRQFGVGLGSQEPWLSLNLGDSLSLNNEFLSTNVPVHRVLLSLLVSMELPMKVIRFFQHDGIMA